MSSDASEAVAAWGSHSAAYQTLAEDLVNRAREREQGGGAGGGDTQSAMEGVSEEGGGEGREMVAVDSEESRVGDSDELAVTEGGNLLLVKE